MNRFTIVGGRGFIGGALATHLRRAGYFVAVFSHLERDIVADESLGHVVYASGIAASVAGDADYAFGAHVEGARKILAAGTFDSFLYLSSTRVYGASPQTSEGMPLSVEPTLGAGDVYRISKIAGEALCLAQPLATVRVARLSNVAGENYDATVFLSDVLRQAGRDRRAVVHTTRDSAKDYIAIGDVCRYVESIALHGSSRIYNVASGVNVENGAIFDVLQELGVDVVIARDAARIVSAPIDSRKLQTEFGPPREHVLDALPELLARFTVHAQTAVG